MNERNTTIAGQAWQVLVERVKDRRQGIDASSTIRREAIIAADAEIHRLRADRQKLIEAMRIIESLTHHAIATDVLREVGSG